MPKSDKPNNVDHLHFGHFSVPPSTFGAHITERVGDTFRGIPMTRIFPAPPMPCMLEDPVADTHGRFGAAFAV